ncbi:hypothetical protein [Terrihalobacillus insolitus]|uniref:hypothetical protein n=1 Tax=Terrihalobacillus insolitus TaxID=2950438 RepID=UPI0023422F74|nr:hypothetical protein [Terrihalobacillus insolitus]
MNLLKVYGLDVFLNSILMNSSVEIAIQIDLWYAGARVVRITRLYGLGSLIIDGIKCLLTTKVSG